MVIYKINYCIYRAVVAAGTSAAAVTSTTLLLLTYYKELCPQISWLISTITKIDVNCHALDTKILLIIIDYWIDLTKPEARWYTPASNIYRIIADFCHHFKMAAVCVTSVTQGLKSCICFITIYTRIH